MSKWEYKIFKVKVSRFFEGDFSTDKTENSYNHLGKEGWELVSSFDLNMDEGQSSMVVAIFKRPLHE